MAQEQTKKTLVIFKRKVCTRDGLIPKYGVAYLLSQSSLRAEVRLPNQRCDVFHCYLFDLNGEESPIANILHKIRDAREVFDEAVSSNMPKPYLKECKTLLEEVQKYFIGHKCHDAKKGSDKCLLFVRELLKEVKEEGRISYREGAEYFREHIEELSKNCARLILNNLE